MGVIVYCLDFVHILNQVKYFMYVNGYVFIVLLFYSSFYTNINFII